MLSYKHNATFVLLSACSFAFADNTVAQQEEPRVVNITQCSKISFQVTLDQTSASQEEREQALAIISTFCAEDIKALSDELANNTPHVNISIILVHVEEDSTSNDDDTVESNENSINDAASA